MFLLGLATFFVYLKGIVRVSSVHLLQSIVPATVLFFVLIAWACRDNSDTATPARTRRFALGSFAAVTGATFMFASAATTAGKAYESAHENWLALRPYMPEAPRGLHGALAQICTPSAGMERAHCFKPREQDLAAINVLHERTSPTEPIYVGTDRHDRVFVNNIMLYFLAARPSVTKWHQFDPDIQTTRRTQEQMVDELTRQSVRYLVLSSEWSDVIEPNASAFSSGVTVLDEYIRANFAEFEEVGGAAVWKRRGSSDDLQQARPEGATPVGEALRR